MAHGSASATGGQLLEELRCDLADVDGAIRSHRFLAGLEARRVLRAGGSPHRARRAAGLLQAYELLFWDTLAEGDT